MTPETSATRPRFRDESADDPKAIPESELQTHTDPLATFYSKAFWAAFAVCLVAVFTAIIGTIKLNSTVSELVVGQAMQTETTRELKTNIEKMLTDRYTLTAALADRKLAEDRIARNEALIVGLKNEITDLRVWRASQEKRP